jgi:AcrR family transcriptional regulator
VTPRPQRLSREQPDRAGATTRARGEPASRIGERRRAAVEARSPDFLARRHEIVRAAAIVFSRIGYDRATLADFARQAGMKRAAIYYYYSCKEEIFQELMHEIILGNLDRLRVISQASMTAAEKLRLAVQDMMESYDRNYPHHYVYVRTDLDALRRVDATKAQQILDAADAYVAALVGIVAEGQEHGEFHRDATADVLTFAVLGMVNWTHQWYRPGGRYSAAELGTIFGDLALRGLRGDQPGPVKRRRPRASTSARRTAPAPDAAT